MRHKGRWGVGVGAVLLTAAFIAGAGAGPGRQTALVDPNNPAPAGRVVRANDVMVMGAWINGKGYIIRLPAQTVIAGDVERLETRPDAKAVMDSLPRRVPELDRPATPAETEAFGKVLDAEVARFSPPTNAPPANRGVVPPVPGRAEAQRPAVVADWTPPSVGERITEWTPPPGLS